MQLRQLLVGSGLLALALALAGPGHAAVGGPEVIPPEGVRVAAVEIRGNQRVSRESILTLIGVRPGVTVTRQELERDAELLRRQGFFRAVAPPAVEITPEGARITFVVEELPALRGVQFTGNTVLTAEELQRIVDFQTGELFSRQTLVRRIQAIETAYRQRGYVARVGDPQVSPEGILIIPIHEARVADVEISGLRRVRESIVRRAIELEPGDLFTEDALRRDFVRLQQFGLFERIDPVVTFTPGGDIVVSWDFEEARSRAINLGLSYSPRDSLVGTVRFEEKNFRGRAEQLQVGLNISSIQAQLGGEVAYAAPPLIRRIGYQARAFSLVEFRFSQRVLSNTTLDLDRYFERHNGLQLGLVDDLRQGRRLSLTTRYEAVDVFNLPTEFLQPGVPSLDSSLLAVGAQLSRDRRDALLYPTLGSYAVAAADAGWVSRASSDASGLMLKPQAEWRAYLPLNRPRVLTPAEGAERERTRVLAFRVLAGTTVGELPFFEQYFLGGVNNLRGYLEDRFWGRNLVAANAELRWPLGRGLIGAAFVDAGHAWGSDFQFVPSDDFTTPFRQSSGFSPRIGVGVGVRYLTPLGPLRLDFAYGETFRTHFTVGQTF
ncbi:MAG: BamA/TamA family outer membrane protein [Armatimonadetes bacterium]|nr:BamA/TamA family outer membrane protein [Armatimonadota bacterium]